MTRFSAPRRGGLSVLDPASLGQDAEGRTSLEGSEQVNGSRRTRIRSTSSVRRSMRATFKSPESNWMTHELITAPRYHMREHIKHVLLKRSFFLALLIGLISAVVTAYTSGRSVILAELPDDKLYTTFSTLVSFFIVIRTGHALSRLFEAAGMVYSILGDWSDATSSLLSFTRCATIDDESVLSFQNMLVILVSMLNALCLAELEDTASMQADQQALDYNLINFVGFPVEALTEISQSERKAETVFQMIQALIVDNMDNGLLNVPAPILTRSFQEMSQAMLKVHEAHKLVHVSYPVDLNAASSFFLVIFTIITVWYVPHWIHQYELALVAVFVLVFSYWFVHFICGELEQPFSSRCTAIDLARVQDELNIRLQTFVAGARRDPLPLRPDCSSPRDKPMVPSFRGVQSFVSGTNSQGLSRPTRDLAQPLKSSLKPSSDEFILQPVPGSAWRSHQHRLPDDTSEHSGDCFTVGVNGGAEVTASEPASAEGAQEPDKHLPPWKPGKEKPGVVQINVDGAL